MNGCINQAFEAWAYSVNHNGQYTREQLVAAFKAELLSKENFILGFVAGATAGGLNNAIGEITTKGEQVINTVVRSKRVLKVINNVTKFVNKVTKIPLISRTINFVNNSHHALKKIRDKISKITAGVLTITTWNMKNLTSKSIATRQKKEIKKFFSGAAKYTAIFVLQEIQDKTVVNKELWPFKWGPNFSVKLPGKKMFFSPYIKISSKRSLNNEYFVFMINPLIRLMYNVKTYEARHIPIIHKYRNPYTLILTNSRYKIAISNVHFRPNDEQTKNRFDELKNLSSSMNKLRSIKKTNIIFTGDFNIKPKQFSKVFKKETYRGKPFEVAKLLKKYDMKLTKTVKTTSIKSVYEFANYFIKDDFDSRNPFTEAIASTVNDKGILSNNLYDHTITSKKTTSIGIIHDNLLKENKNFFEISDHLPVTFLIKFKPSKSKVFRKKR